MTAGRIRAGYALDGIFAGAVFAFAQMLTCSFSGRSPLLPFQLAASGLLGPRALSRENADVLVVGVVVFALVSSAMGLLYHRYSGVLSDALTRAGRLRPSASGPLFAMTLWFPVTLTARALLPWLLAAGHVYDAWLYVLCFGLPLGLFAARTERRQPVELKIVYSSTPPSSSRGATTATDPRSAPNARAKGAPPRSSRKRSPLEKRPPLRLLVKSPGTGPKSNGEQ